MASKLGCHQGGLEKLPGGGRVTNGEDEDLKGVCAEVRWRWRRRNAMCVDDGRPGERKWDKCSVSRKRRLFAANLMECYFRKMVHSFNGILCNGGG